MSSVAARLGPEPATANIPDHIKLALTYAEESSKRARWIIFIIQIAAILVLASVWEEANFNWLTLRLKAAQKAVRYLECGQEGRSPHPNSPDALSDAIDNRKKGKVTAADKGSTPLTLEELDIAHNCAANPLNEEDEKTARDYLTRWHYSLTQARKNVADLQQVVGNRVLGVGVPILGIIFDVNDLSIVSGITFSILLSWFYYNVRRQDKNTNHVFEMAENSKIQVDGKSMLETTYNLLRMTQVLTIPPGRARDSRDVTTLRRFTRLPNLILWTPTLALGIVLAEDLSTLDDVTYLHRFVGRFETAFALYLFAYILYRTIRCFQQTRRATEIWVTVWNKIRAKNYNSTGQVRMKWMPPEKQGILDPTQTEAATLPQHSKPSPKVGGKPVEETKDSDKKSSSEERLPILIGIGVLEMVIAAHLLDEYRPDFWRTMTSAFSGSPKTVKMSLLWAWPAHFLAIIAMLAVIIIALRVWRDKKDNLAKARKWVWTLPALALAEILIHLVKGKIGLFQSFMAGFYSAPMMLVTSMVLLYLLRERPRKLPEETDKPETAASAAGA